MPATFSSKLLYHVFHIFVKRPKSNNCTKRQRNPVAKLTFCRHSVFWLRKTRTSESSHTETFSLSRYKNRDTCSRFLWFCDAKSISCALPRVTLHSRKIDFIESITSSSLHSITGEARMTRLPTEKIRGSMSKMCALAEDIGDFRRLSIYFTGKRSSCPPRRVSTQNFLANRSYLILKTKKRLRTQENAQTESLFV